MFKLLLPLALTASVVSGQVHADDFSDKVKQAMKSELRTEKEVNRDRNRKPVQTLEFFGIKEDMRVLELIPGGGWYTKLLAPALRDKGQYYAALGTSRIEKNLLGKGDFDKAKVVSKDTSMKYNRDIGGYEIGKINFDLKNLDAVLTFRNYHNFGEEGRHKMNQAAFKALKPGGVYGVIDHTRRHMQKKNDENGRRFDPVLAIKEIQQAGFELVDYSTLHYRADDELRYEVGRKTVTGNTDRFTLLFKKPSK
ncbi:class I SAM-dependent methyltransferase [Psychrobium sp. 1_MG-2023]|uniref:class I SAM-dependent methyltransferase n=1 Tax=Psychrobium sp. 1_MG-2023 TaxID=3062624 RepID=UPI000C349D22|nr:class I SAM-dependent methyltransferase [Psychrobium sp. 1_MG-2023]MDP2562418.1 class I SAM-dependent methyltransferase [Psychrobium sp. 1_MG-2023]PKF56146.1 methyltransferase [Alteromonadales bacterium alter-6D02]